MSEDAVEDPIKRIERKFSEGEPQVIQAVLEGFYPLDFTLSDRMPRLGESLLEFYQDSVQIREAEKGNQRILRANRDGILMILQSESTRFVLTLGTKEIDLDELQEHLGFFYSKIWKGLNAKNLTAIGTRVTMLFDNRQPRIREFDRSAVVANDLQAVLGVQNLKLRQFQAEFGPDDGGFGTKIDLGLKEAKIEIPSTEFKGTRSLKIHGAVLDVIRPYNATRLKTSYLEETLEMTQRTFNEIFGVETSEQ